MEGVSKNNSNKKLCFLFCFYSCLFLLSTEQQLLAAVPNFTHSLQISLNLFLLLLLPPLFDLNI